MTRDTRTPEEAPLDPRYETISDAIYRALVKYDRAKREARDWRLVTRGASPSIVRGTGRSGLTRHLTGAVIAALVEAEAAEPTYMGCGCLVGAHESGLDAIRENHPDVTVPDLIGLSFYGSWRYREDPYDSISTDGPTPTAALQALAAKLREADR